MPLLPLPHARRRKQEKRLKETVADAKKNRKQEGIKAVVLFSGGLDSAVTLEWAFRRGWDCFPLCFDYGQSNRKEITHAQCLISNYFQKKYPRCPELKVCHIPGYGSLCTRCVMTYSNIDGDFDNPKDINVPNRFVVFMSLASAYAVSVGALYVCTGVQVEHDLTDFQGAYDAKRTLVQDCELMAQLHASPYGNRLFFAAPLMDKGKKEIANLARIWGVPAEHTWSCLSVDKDPCGVCVSCRQYRLTGVTPGSKLLLANNR